jgi:hypothetical protein
MARLFLQNTGSNNILIILAILSVAGLVAPR